MVPPEWHLSSMNKYIVWWNTNLLGLRVLASCDCLDEDLFFVDDPKKLDPDFFLKRMRNISDTNPLTANRDIGKGEDY